MLLCDTGVLLAAGNSKDQAHRACVQLLRQAEGASLAKTPEARALGLAAGVARYPQQVADVGHS
jgi:predicted nucleic acid-binding protein